MTGAHVVRRSPHRRQCHIVIASSTATKHSTTAPTAKSVSDDSCGHVAGQCDRSTIASHGLATHAPRWWSQVVHAVSHVTLPHGIARTGGAIFLRIAVIMHV